MCCFLFNKLQKNMIQLTALLRNYHQRRMLLYIIWITVASLLLFAQVVSILVREPTDVFAVRGSTASLSCYTNLSLPVSWEIERTGGFSRWEHFYRGTP